MWIHRSPVCKTGDQKYIYFYRKIYITTQILPKKSQTKHSKLNSLLSKHLINEISIWLQDPESLVKDRVAGDLWWCFTRLADQLQTIARLSNWVIWSWRNSREPPAPGEPFQTSSRHCGMLITLWRWIVYALNLNSMVEVEIVLCVWGLNHPHKGLKHLIGTNI